MAPHPSFSPKTPSPSSLLGAKRLESRLLPPGHRYHTRGCRWHGAGGVSSWEAATVATAQSRLPELGRGWRTQQLGPWQGGLSRSLWSRALGPKTAAPLALAP